MLRSVGCTVIIYNNWDTPDQRQFEEKALQNTKQSTSQKVFQFESMINVAVGSVIQIKGSNDLWRVVDTEDNFVGGEFFCFEAFVVKIDKQGKETRPSLDARVHIGGSVIGALQVGGEGNVQNISIVISPKFDDAVSNLLKIVSDSSLPNLEKEDAIEAIQRLPQLANLEKSPTVIERAKQRLDLVKSTIETGTTLAPIALPYLQYLYQWFSQ